MRFALALLMALHGIAHLPGFLVPWRLLRSPELPYATTVLSGRVDLGDAGIRVLGVFFLLVGSAFLVAAWLTWSREPGWIPVAGAVTAASLLLTVVAWPLSRVGVLVNLALAVGIGATAWLAAP